TTVTLPVGQVVVKVGRGAVVLDDDFQGPALLAPGASGTLIAGAGGVRVANPSPTGAARARAGQLTRRGAVCSPDQPRVLDVASLFQSQGANDVSLRAVGDLAIEGFLTVGGTLSLTLPGTFTFLPGSLSATAIDLAFTGAGPQDFDSNALSFRNIV